MPRYDFHCRRCDASYEKRLSMGEYADREGWACPECGSDDEVERSWSPVAVVGGSSRSGGSGPACAPGSGFT